MLPEGTLLDQLLLQVRNAPVYLSAVSFMNALPITVAALPEIIVHRGEAAEHTMEGWNRLRTECGGGSPGLRHEWLAILREGLGHTPYCLEARRGEETVGLLAVWRLCGRCCSADFSSVCPT